MSTTATATAPRPNALRDFDPDAQVWRANAETRKKGLDALISYKIKDVRVLDTSSTDLMRSKAEEAHALCTILSVSIAKMTDPKTGEVPLWAPHISRAIAAIDALILLSVFASEDLVSSDLRV